jgi:DNA-binding MarR family transcriptional regulator
MSPRGRGALGRADEDLRLDAYLPYRLSVASNAVSGLIARAYQDRFGLTVPQWRLICVLAEDGGLTQGQLVARTVMDKVTVSRAAQGLLNRHLVARSEHQADGRSHVLALTSEGGGIAGLAPDEVALLKRLLTRLQSSAGQLAGEANPRPAIA